MQKVVLMRRNETLKTSSLLRAKREDNRLGIVRPSVCVYVRGLLAEHYQSSGSSMCLVSVSVGADAVDQLLICAALGLIH